MSVQTPHTFHGYPVRFDELEPEDTITMRKRTFEKLSHTKIEDSSLPVRAEVKPKAVEPVHVPAPEPEPNDEPDPLAHMDPDAPQDYTGPDKPVPDAPLPDHPAVENQPPEPPEPGTSS